MFRQALIGAALAFAASATVVHAQTVAPATPIASPAAVAGAVTDPYLWLEDIASPRSTAWVAAENAKTLGMLQSDPHYPALEADALAIAQAKDRIPSPEIINGRIYNFWQDADHVRGIWRWTTPADFSKARPNWTTALDIDSLARAGNANWVWEGADCVWPREERCLVRLSDGGEDAVTMREFDRRTGAFVRDGFVLPRGKQDGTWESDDTLLVAREWAPGELTASGYPYVVKRVRRGHPLAQAQEIFRGTKTDINVSAAVYHDAQNDRVAVIDRGVTFFTSEKYLLTAHGTNKLGVPPKSSFDGVIAGRALITLAEDWTSGGKTFTTGSLVSVEIAAMNADPAHLKPTLVYEPGPRDSIDMLATTKSRLLLTTFHNVRGRAFVFQPVVKGWMRRPLDLPDNSSIHIADTDVHGETAFLAVTGFLTPTTLEECNAAKLAPPAVVKSLPAKFDASKDVVEQREAMSKDGTRIPYFLVHPKTMALDGTNPTILGAYGGFQISLTPTYNADIGKLWLERGGVYVVANIRGGGEFGPAWHEAGLKTNRQRIYDDFAAVANDLIATKVTSPAHLGIRGGSNGGLLMGVEFNQHPDLWNAVEMAVPLLDMLRFEQIAAGASWVGEYGSVAIPEQRAFLASISPYSNLKPDVTYPEPFIWTTTKDDRVGPQHARKFAARLAEYGKPYLFYEVTEGGHGAGANLKERAHTMALEMTYFTRKLMAAP